MTAPLADRTRVPRLLLLTDRNLMPAGQQLDAAVEAALGGGVDGVIVRERDLDSAERAALGERVRARTVRHGASFGWAAPLPGRSGDGDGVHLRAQDPFPEARPVLVGRSCHNADDLRRADVERCDYVTLSPMARTDSKPGYGPPLGRAGLAGMLAAAAYGPRSPRVLALGGVSPDLVQPLLDVGAHGVAVMGSLLRHNDICSRAQAYAVALTAATAS